VPWSETHLLQVQVNGCTRHSQSRHHLFSRLDSHVCQRLQAEPRAGEAEVRGKAQREDGPLLPARKARQTVNVGKRLERGCQLLYVASKAPTAKHSYNAREGVGTSRAISGKEGLSMRPAALAERGGGAQPPAINCDGPPSSSAVTCARCHSSEEALQMQLASGSSALTTTRHSQLAGLIGTLTPRSLAWKSRRKHGPLVGENGLLYGRFRRPSLA
jgi:hypothetical protein